MITVRVIKPGTIRRYVKECPEATTPLMNWLKIARKARWQSLHDVRESFPSADGATVQSGHTVTVFNIGGNKYRLIVAINFRYAIIYVLRFLTHAEYDK